MNESPVSVTFATVEWKIAPPAKGDCCSFSQPLNGFMNG
jgi:hypothetical protein